MAARRLAAGAAALCLPAAALAQSPAGRVPTPEQLSYQRKEVSMFMHFSMCTFAGCEQDTACRKNPPSLFAPTALNTTQWVATAAALGAKEICLTAHHTGGFALFQSEHTNYSVRQSPYRGGRGDIVAEFTASCRAFGISPCLYFIPHWDCWESQDAPDVYLDRQLGMLTELMNRSRYGKIDRFWFDQWSFSSNGGQSPSGVFPDAYQKIADHVHATSPGTLMLPGPDGCINPGEGGGGEYPVINYVDNAGACSYHYSPSPGGKYYVPWESDLSIQNPGDAWFWHKGHVYNTGAELFAKYLATVGRGSHFILNVPPNTTGIIPDEFVRAVTEVGDAVRRSFGVHAGSTAAAAGGACGALTVVVAATGPFDAVMMQEELSKGQQVLGYTLELQDRDTNAWTAVKLDPKQAGQTVGQKSIAVLPGGTSNARAVRFKCTKAIGGDDATVTLASVSLHTIRAPPPPPPPPASPLALRTYVHARSGGGNETAPCAARDHGACSTYTRAGYKLLRAEATVWSSAASGATKRIHLIYSQKLDDNSLSDGSGSSTPSGYADESGTGEVFYIYAAPNASLVPLDLYYDDATSDHWALASDASRAEATGRGFKKAGTLGYVRPA